MNKAILFSFTLIALLAIFNTGDLASQQQNNSGPAATSPGGSVGSNPNKPATAKEGDEKSKEAQLNVVEGYQSNDRWREGAKIINMLGRFQTTGERIQFAANDGKLQLTVIENLGAERVYQMITENTDVKDHDWMIQGTITEYRGTNYLILGYAKLINQNVPTKNNFRPQSKPAQNPIP